MPTSPVVFPSFHCTRHSELEHAEFLNVHLAAELSAGGVSGPFQGLPYSSFVSSSLGVIPKKDPRD